MKTNCFTSHDEIKTHTHEKESKLTTFEDDIVTRRKCVIRNISFQSQVKLYMSTSYMQTLRGIMGVNLVSRLCFFLREEFQTTTGTLLKRTNSLYIYFFLSSFGHLCNFFKFVKFLAHSRTFENFVKPSQFLLTCQIALGAFKHFIFLFFCKLCEMKIWCRVFSNFSPWLIQFPVKTYREGILKRIE